MQIRTRFEGPQSASPGGEFTASNGISGLAYDLLQDLRAKLYRLPGFRSWISLMSLCKAQRREEQKCDALLLILPGVWAPAVTELHLDGSAYTSLATLPATEPGYYPLSLPCFRYHQLIKLSQNKEAGKGITRPTY